MRLVLLVLAIICASTRADAERIVPPDLIGDCTCMDRVLPGVDEYGVPTNARRWTLPSVDRPDEPLALEPNTTYTLPSMSFTTDAVEDHEAPAAPHKAQVWIDIEHGGRARSPISGIGIATDLDRDARILRVTITDKLGSVVYYADAGRPGYCGAGLAILPGVVQVSITAIDLAGNESPPAVVTVNPRVYLAARRHGCRHQVAEQDEWRLHDLVDHGDHHPRRHGQVDNGVAPPQWSALTLAALAGAMGIPAFVIILGVAKRRRALARMAAPIEPFAIASVDELVRTIRNHAVLVLALVATASSLAMHSSGLQIAALVASPLIVWAAAQSIARLWAAHRALQLIAHADAIAEARHDQVDVIARGQHAVLRASPSRVQRAKARGVPRASVDLK